ncbi:TVP38/TMEM64 family protein [Oscillospiraceae bacterium OttesenSCG-928-F05]|nr:TVP38/TMEM64 family protein [Oscillospiraceae bacterium OttesenSCG-928-F05]
MGTWKPTEKTADRLKKCFWWAGLFLLLLLVVGGFFFLWKTGNLDIFTSRESLQAFIEKAGIWGPVLFCAVQMAQVIVSLVPGNVTTLIGAAMFGFWPGFLLSAFSIVVGSVICFAIARKLGRPLVRRLVSEKTFDRYFDTLSARPKIAAAMMMLLPFFPDDLICFILGITGISFRSFFWIIVIFRPWGLLVSALIGAGAFSLPMWAMILIGIASVAVGILAVRYGPAFEEKMMRKIKKKKR